MVFIRRPIIPPTLPVSPLDVVRSPLPLQIHVRGLTPNPTLNPQPRPKIIHLILCDPAPSPPTELIQTFSRFLFFSLFLWVYMMKPLVLYTSNGGGAGGRGRAGLSEDDPRRPISPCQLTLPLTPGADVPCNNVRLREACAPGGDPGVHSQTISRL